MEVLPSERRTVVIARTFQYPTRDIASPVEKIAVESTFPPIQFCQLDF
jgi:hypothetical protein